MVGTTASKFAYVEGGWRTKEETRRRLLLSFFQCAATCDCLEISFAEFSNLLVNLTKGMPAIKETSGVGIGTGLITSVSQINL